MGSEALEAASESFLAIDNATTMYKYKSYDVVLTTFSNGSDRSPNVELIKMTLCNSAGLQKTTVDEMCLVQGNIAAVSATSVSISAENHETCNLYTPGSLI